MNNITTINAKEEVLNFSLIVEQIASSKKIPYLEALILHCDNIGLEYEVAAKLISNKIKSKISTEAAALHLLPKSSTKKLPLKRKE